MKQRRIQKYMPGIELAAPAMDHKELSRTPRNQLVMLRHRTSSPAREIRQTPTTLLGFEDPNGGPAMMDQRNLIIAGAIAVVAVLAYYYFGNATPAPKKEGTSQNHYHAIPAPMNYASITKKIA